MHERNLESLWLRVNWANSEHMFSTKNSELRSIGLLETEFQVSPLLSELAFWNRPQVGCREQSKVQITDTENTLEWAQGSSTSWHWVSLWLQFIYLLPKRLSCQWCGYSSCGLSRWGPKSLVAPMLIIHCFKYEIMLYIFNTVKYIFAFEFIVRQCHTIKAYNDYT